MLIRNVYYLVQIIFVAAIATSIKASGDKNVLTPIKLLESGAHVTRGKEWRISRLVLSLRNGTYW